MPDPIEVEVVCPSCDGAGAVEGQFQGVVYECGRCGGDKKITATLAPDSLSAAIQRLGWAAVDREEASRVYRVESADPVRDRYNAAITGYRAALAEVHRLRPTPPEGTNG